MLRFVIPKGSLEEQTLLLLERADLRVLFLSGYTEDEVFRRGGGTTAFLHKPFLPTALTAKVREVLNGQVHSPNQ